MTLVDDVRKNFKVNNLYEVLRIPINSSQQDIKTAYLRRCLELHPDKATNANSDDNQVKLKFQILSEVYKVLSNLDTRVDYDKQIQPATSEIFIDSTIHEEIFLKECSKEGEFYSARCRCSGAFKLDEKLVVETAKSCCTQQIAFVVDCDSCSNSIKIILE